MVGYLVPSMVGLEVIMIDFPGHFYFNPTHLIGSATLKMVTHRLGIPAKNSIGINCYRMHASYNLMNGHRGRQGNSNEPRVASTELRGADNRHGDFPWNSVAGMRDRLIHDYFLGELGHCVGCCHQ